MFLLCIVLLLVLHLIYTFTYWKRHGFTQINPTSLFGCMWPFLCQRKNAARSVSDLYNKSTEPFVGIYAFHLPQLMIRDLDLVRRIMITDFEYFTDRDVYLDVHDDPLSANVLSQRGKVWKELRYKLSPMFSSKQLKTMFPIFLDEIDKMDKHLEKCAENRVIVNLRDTLTNCTLNVIASVFFGLDVDTLENPNHPFKRMYHLTSKPPSFLEVFRQSATYFFPQMLDLFGMHSVNKEICEYFTQIVRATVEHRKQECIKRNDILQQLIDLSSETGSKMSIEEIAGNSYIFFFGGAETTTSLTFFTLLEMSRNPDIWRKAQKDVDTAMKANNFEFNYDTVNGANYIELCMKEARRLYTGFAVESRKVVKDYKVPGHDVTFKKGTTILLPIGPIHVDPKHYPKNPTQYIPERFEKDSGMMDEKAFFLAGAGPRFCIAIRMGFMQSKAVIMKILYKYDLELVQGAGESKFEPKAATTLLKESVLVRLKLRKLPN